MLFVEIRSIEDMFEIVVFFKIDGKEKEVVAPKGRHRLAINRRYRRYSVVYDQKAILE